MKLNEKNVLIGTGIIIVIMFGILEFGHERLIDKTLEVKIASSFYDVNNGKLILQFENPIEHFNEFHITIVDQHDNFTSGTSKQINDTIIFDTFMPNLHFRAPLEVKIEEVSTQKEVTVEYQIPELYINV